MSSYIDSSQKHAVSLLPCSSYTRQEVEEAVNQAMSRAGIVGSQNASFEKAPFPLSRGTRVLVKPNLVRAIAPACTHAEVVRAVCVCLQEAGAQVQVLDSPGFGTAPRVAEKIGLAQALAPLGLKVQEFSAPHPLVLPNDLGVWQVGREAIEAEAILSLPRLKVHNQMRVTLAVKNIFGCVCGMSKALAHTRQGRCLEDFCRCIWALYTALPPTAAVLDGVVGMHVKGPSGGKEIAIHCIGASVSAQALDTAIYTLLGLEVSQVPLWQEAQRTQQQPQQRSQESQQHKAQQPQFSELSAENIHFTDMQPSQFDFKNFIIPEVLEDISFQPHRLLLSFVKRFWRQYF